MYDINTQTIWHHLKNIIIPVVVVAVVVVVVVVVVDVVVVVAVVVVVCRKWEDIFLSPKHLHEL